MKQNVMWINEQLRKRTAGATKCGSGGGGRKAPLNFVGGGGLNPPHLENFL